MRKMNRLKFLVFALVTAGLWAYHVVVSGAAVLKANEPFASGVMGAGPAVALRIEAQRSEVQAALVELAGSPAAWNLPRGAGKDGPSVERFNAIRQVLSGVLSEANKPDLVVGLLTDQGSLFARGAAEPSAPPLGFDLSAVAQGGAAGSIVPLGEVPHIFFAVPLLVVDRNEVQPGGRAVAGLPVLPDAKRLESIAKDLHLSTLAVVSEGKVLLAAGTEKVQAEPALKALKAGQVTSMGGGAVRRIGPLELPLFADAGHARGSRQVLAGTPFEVLAVVSLRGPLESLAAYQLFGILGLVGIVLLGLVVGLLIKSEDEGGTRVSLPPPLPMPPMKKEKEESPPVALPVGPEGRGPEGSPDDFQFPPSTASAVRGKDVVASAFASSEPQLGAVEGAVATGASLPAEPGPLQGFGPLPGTRESGPVWAGPSSPSGPPEQDPFAVASPSGFATARPGSPPPLSGFNFPPSASSSTPGGPDHEGFGYPGFAPGGDPFAATGPLEPTGGADDSPDATRVSEVPQELLRATREGISTGPAGERPSMRHAGEGPPRVQSLVAPPSLDPEERHYQDVYREFIATKEKCGEAADGLTYERFKAKLLKNRDQLMSKYQCRTVRFQVYVKEGKAALKATPVKD